jgi:dTDP-4-dehydrorhamnose reductase
MNGRALILGSRGQLGGELVREFASRGYEVAAFARTQLDISDPVEVDEQVAAFQPTVIVNSAAFNPVDPAEKDPLAALKVNGLGVRNLATACRQSKAKLIHFSTDYVFDGTKGSSYTEDDRPHPLGAYGVSKLAGEFYAQAYLDDPLIIRTSAVFGVGGLRTPRGNFVELMLRLAKSGQTLRVVDDQVASPTFAPLLASRAADLLEKGAHGIFHVGGGTPISWFDYAGKIFHLAGVNPEVLRIKQADNKTAAARRPQYSALSNAKMESLGVAPFPPLESSIVEYLNSRIQELAVSEGRAIA